MCNPALVVAGASLAGTAMSVVGKLAQHSEQAKLKIDNTGAINSQLAQVYNSNTARQIQEADKAATESFDVLRGMAVAKGKATAAAGEAGVSGVSFVNILSDFEMSEGMAVGKNEYNYNVAVAQLDAQNRAARTKAVSQINTTPTPSEAGLWMGIGADVAKAGLKIADAFEWGKDTPVDPEVDPKSGVVLTTGPAGVFPVGEF